MQALMNKRNTRHARRYCHNHNKARNSLRLEKFIEKKKASALNSNSKTSSAERNTFEVALKENESITSSTFKCDHCDY